jgi:hypothetical protein
MSDTRKTRISFKWLWTILGLGLAGLIYASFPRHPNLAGFKPDAVARIETAMWRDYYEKRYVALFGALYGLARDQYGFSPADSVRIAIAAAGAAAKFQPTRSRAEAETALPALTVYYRLLAKGARHPFDIDAAARRELEWWRARREAAAPEAYGLTIAKTGALVYGVDNPSMHEAGILRAQAMAYRDAKGGTIQDADWQAIELQLRTAYDGLERAIR